jgi:hypothetical protein
MLKIQFHITVLNKFSNSANILLHQHRTLNLSKKIIQYRFINLDLNIKACKHNVNARELIKKINFSIRWKILPQLM